MKKFDKTAMTEADKEYIRESLRNAQSPDRLKELFRMQEELDSFIFEQHSDKLPENLREWVLRYTLAIDSELDEIRRVVGFKWWKDNGKIDVEHLHEEVSDLWFFLIALTQRVGMSADDIFKVYELKREENFKRQLGTSTEKDYRNGGNE